MNVEPSMVSILSRAFFLVLSARILHAAFGWAAVMLLGKVPRKRQSLLSGIAFGSVAWMIVLLGTVFPPFASFVLAFVLPPDWVETSGVWLALLVASISIPLMVGFVSLLVLEPEDRPRGVGAKAAAMLKGYPYTLGLAITLIMMTALAPIMTLQSIVKRRASQHIPVVLEPDHYLEVVGDVERALSTGGLKTARQPASWVVRYPTKILTVFAGGTLLNLMADTLTTLKSPQIEVVLHPSDLVIRGRERDVARARTIIEEQLAFSKAYTTWTKEANELEDRLCSIWHDRKDGPNGAIRPESAERLKVVERDLRALLLPHDEWEAVLRRKLLIECALLRQTADLAEKPGDLTEATPRARAVAPVA